MGSNRSEQVIQKSFGAWAYSRTVIPSEMRFLLRATHAIKNQIQCWDDNIIAETVG